jgi:hypothetical protein
MPFPKFDPASAAASAPAASAPASPGRSKYAGIQCGDARDPMLECGTYRLRLISAAEGANPKTGRASYKITAKVESASEDAGTPAGSVCVIVHLSTPIGMSELKSTMVYAAGCGPTLAQRASSDVRALAQAGEAAYDQADADVYPGSIIEATAGAANGAPSMIGRLVDVVVTRGKDTADGSGWYRSYRWGVVPEDEQTEA